MIVLDFETVYGKGYTLRGPKGMSIVEYVRDPRFKILVCSITVDEAKPIHYRSEQLPTVFATINWDQIVVAHHAHFEAFILSEKFNIRPARVECTLAMSQYVHQGAIDNSLESVSAHEGLPAKDIAALEAFKDKTELTDEEFEAAGIYCDQDVWNTREIYRRYRPQMQEREIELMHLVIRMFAQPKLYVNETLAREAMNEEILERNTLIAETGYTEKQLSSNPQFAEILRKAGVEPPMKISPRTKKPAYAFSKSDVVFQQLKADERPLVRQLYNARIAAKSTQGFTKAARLLRHTAGGQTLPIYYRFWGGHTGRLSGGDKTNVQAFKRKSKQRRSIIAPEGYVIGVSDSAQIEPRVEAELAGQTDLVEAFRRGEDVYSQFASTIYGRHVDRKKVESDFLAGFVGKVCILGLGYQMGAPKFRNTLACGALGGPPVFIDDAMAYKIVHLYRQRYPMIPALWAIAEQALMAMATGGEFTYKMLYFCKDGVRLPNNTWMRFPDLHLDHNNSFVYRCGPDEWTSIYGGKFVENIIQALSRIIVTDQTLVINQRYQVVMSTHDEAASLIPHPEADAGLRFMLDTMATPPLWMPNLPLAAEGGWDTCYSK